MTVGTYDALPSLGEELLALEAELRGRMAKVTAVNGTHVKVQIPGPDATESMGWHPCTIRNVAVGTTGVLQPLLGNRSLFVPVGYQSASEISDITGLQAALDSKASVNHNHRDATYTSSTVVGGGSVTSTNAVAVGGANNIGDRSTGIGTSVDGKNAMLAVLVGHWAGQEGAGDYSVAVGQSADAVFANSVAIGSSAKADSDNGIAIGANAQTSGSFGVVVVGRSASGSAERAAVFGYSAIGSGARSVALGPGAEATGETAIAIGYATQVSGIRGWAIGYNADNTANDTGLLGADVVKIRRTRGATGDTQLVLQDGNGTERYIRFNTFGDLIANNTVTLYKNWAPNLYHDNNKKVSGTTTAAFRIAPGNVHSVITNLGAGTQFYDTTYRQSTDESWGLCYVNNWGWGWIQASRIINI